MCSKSIFFLAIITVSIFFHGHQVESKRNKVAKNKEIERQLRSLNKPSVKSIKTQQGDIFDCVDIHKQPAFDHPALVNHTIQMRPSWFPREAINEIPSSSIGRGFELPDGGCPSGTVPIRRTQKDDIIRWKSLPDFNLDFHPQTSSFPNYHFALLETHKGSGVQDSIYGASAYLGMYNVSCTGQQHSRAAIWVLNGEIERRNGVVAGWIAYPLLYGDSLTRNFISWQDGIQKKSCFNTMCPGFVHVNPKIALGHILHPISIPGGKGYELYVEIQKDQKTRNWWFIHGNGSIPVGYWPESIFSDFEFATTAHFGGEAYQPPGQLSPPMGSGRFSKEGFQYACEGTSVQIMDYEGRFSPPSKHNTGTYADVPNCYTAGFDKYYLQVGYSFTFGGPGGDCGS